MPASALGSFTDEVENYVGFDAEVVFSPAHDTASAVNACNLKGHSIYISSGTWSLIELSCFNKRSLKCQFYK